MDPQEGDTARGPNGEMATFRNGQWVVGAPQGQSGWQVQPMQSPADQRADTRLSMAEDSAARQVANDERRIAMDAQGQTREGFKDEVQLKAQFMGNPRVREYGVIQAQFDIIRTVANDSSPAGDLALVTSYMKMLDPGSVVREQEFANAANAGGAAERARAMLSNITGNGILTPKQRADFVAQTTNIYKIQTQSYNEIANDYRRMASDYGFEPDRIATPIDIAATPPVEVNEAPLSEEEQRDPNLLVAQGYKYDGETDKWVRDPNAESAIEARKADTGIGRRVDAFGRGVADGASFGFADEFAAGMNTLLPLDRGSVSGFGREGGFRAAYDSNLAVQRGVDQADASQMPITRGAGQVTGAVVAPGAMTGGRYIAAAPTALQAAGRGAGVGAMAGAAYGAGSSVGPAENMLEGARDGAGMGAMTGGVLSGGGRVVGSAIGNATRGAMSSPRGQMVQTLTDNGVSLTPGQRIGGPVQTVENLAQRAPILGPAIRGARERGVESLNRAVGNRALDAIGEGVPADVPVGGEMVQQVQSRLGAEFDRAYSMVPSFTPDEPLMQGLGRIGQAKTDLPPQMQQQFDAIIGERLARLQGDVSGQQVGAIRTELNGLASGYLRSQDPAQQGLGQMLTDVADELDGAITRANPEAGAILGNARDGYADYIRLERASTAAGGRPFSVSQLEGAVKASDGSVRRGAVGRNDARMQDLSKAARTIMPDQFGNPGTADAVGLGGLGVGMVTEPVTTTVIAGGLTAAATPYFMMGRNVVEKLPANASRQQLEAAVSELEGLARQDSNVIVLRDEIARRIGQTVPAAAQLSTPDQRPMTGTRPR